jgi:Acetyltransferase (GNAT) domain
VLLNPGTAPPTIDWYEAGLPDGLDQEISRLYSNFYVTTAYLAVFAGDAHLHACVLRQQGQPVAIFLYSKAARHLHVHCFQSRIAAGLLATFTQQAFAHYPGLQRIEFAAMDAAPDALHQALGRRPHQIDQLLEDYVLVLPRSVEAYHQRLAKRTRRKAAYGWQRLKEAHPSSRFEVQEAGRADPHRLAEIMLMSRLRLIRAGVSWARGDALDEGMVRLISHCVIANITVDGAMAAGLTAFVSGRNSTFDTTAQSALFNDYSVGFLNFYLLICRCIELGLSEIHFQGGSGGYKERLGCERRPLQSVIVYRSNLSLLRSARTALGRAVEANRLKLRKAVSQAPGVALVRALLQRLKGGMAARPEPLAGGSGRQRRAGA